MVDLLLDVQVGQIGVQDREQDRREAGEGADHQSPADGGRPGGGVHLLEVAEDVVGPAAELGAGRGRAGAAGVALEQLGAAQAFQPAQSLGRGGLRDAQFAGGRADGARAGDGLDQPQVLDRW